MKVILLVLLSLSMIKLPAQAPASPCSSDPVYRQFDFWIGEWDVYNLKGMKSGESKISLILDSCIILEEWTSMAAPGAFPYKGKSFNTYNAKVKQWQQTWVDNAGSSTHYIYGKADGNKIEFKTAPVSLKGDTMAIYRLTFFSLEKNKVRQLGELSKDNGLTWTTQYDLEYRRRK
ncbi:MAG: hypothetical protein ACO1OO_02110 [Flavisolibacter sp.]